MNRTGSVLRDDHSLGDRDLRPIIAALMTRPDLLVLDEPTSGFHPLVEPDAFAATLRKVLVG